MSRGTEARTKRSGFGRYRFGKERRSFFPIFPFSSLCAACALRGGGGGGEILSIGIALALLILSVPDASAQQFASRNPDKDISTSGLGQHNKNPRGVWMGVVDGQKVMLVLDARHKKIFTYSMETDPLTRLDKHHNDRAAATKKDIEGDSNADGIYKYGELGKDREYGPTAGPDGIRGNDDDEKSDDQIIVNADDFFLLVRKRRRRLQERHLESKIARDSRQYPYGGRDYTQTNSVSVLPLLPNPYGIWSDGTTLWVSDFTDAKIYAYDLSWHLSTVSENTTRKYAMGTFNESKKFNAHDENTTDSKTPRPQGIWANGAAAGSTMWIADDRVKKIFAYEYDGTAGKFQRKNNSKYIWRQGNAADPGFDDKDLTGIQGIWSDGETMWVVDNEGIQSGDEQKILAYSLTGSLYRDTAKDYRMLGNFGNDRPRGIWSDGETVWVAHFKWSGTESKLFAYDLDSKARDVGEDFDTLLDAENKNPVGLWSNGTTMWVADSVDQKLYAYKMSDKSRDADKDFGTLAAAGNEAPFGIWSNGTVMWVSDETDDKIYAYRMPPASGATSNSDFFFSEDSTLKDLQLSGATLTPAFSADNLYYTALVDHTVHSATVTASPNDAGAAVDIFSGGRGTTRITARKGPQVSLEEGYNIIAIDVTAESRTAQSTYIIEVTKAEAPPVSGGLLPQPQSFQPSTTSSANQADLAGSSAGLGEWKSRLIFAEPLLEGGVRFVFLVPAEELKIETTPDLPSREWRPLLDDEFKATRESNVDGQDRLTIILPKAAGKQRFLRLTPQR